MVTVSVVRLARGLFGLIKFDGEDVWKETTLCALSYEIPTAIPGLFYGFH